MRPRERRVVCPSGDHLAAMMAVFESKDPQQVLRVCLDSFVVPPQRKPGDVAHGVLQAFSAAGRDSACPTPWDVKSFHFNMPRAPPASSEEGVQRLTGWSFDAVVQAQACHALCLVRGPVRFSMDGRDVTVRPSFVEGPPAPACPALSPLVRVHPSSSPAVGSALAGLPEGVPAYFSSALASFLDVAGPLGADEFRVVSRPDSATPWAFDVALRPDRPAAAHERVRAFAVPDWRDAHVLMAPLPGGEKHPVYLRAAGAVPRPSARASQVGRQRPPRKTPRTDARPAPGVTVARRAPPASAPGRHPPVGAASPAAKPAVAPSPAAVVPAPATAAGGDDAGAGDAAAGPDAAGGAAARAVAPAPAADAPGAGVPPAPAAGTAPATGAAGDSAVAAGTAAGGEASAAPSAGAAGGAATPPACGACAPVAPGEAASPAAVAASLADALSAGLGGAPAPPPPAVSYADVVGDRPSTGAPDPDSEMVSAPATGFRRGREEGELLRPPGVRAQRARASDAPPAPDSGVGGAQC